MIRRLRAQSIYRKLAYMTLGFMVLLLAWQLVVQRYFVGTVRQLHEANMDYVLGEIVGDINQALSAQGRAVSHIADHVDIKAYVSTDNTEARYRKAYDTARPLVQMATANQLMGHVVVFDFTGAWYQFVGTLSHLECRALRDRFTPLTGQADTVIALDSGLYLCSAAPIFQLERGNLIQRVGLVVMLTSINQFDSLLGDFRQLNAGTILLHDKKTVLLSNDAALGGQPYGAISLRPEVYYIRHEQLLGGLLQVTMLLPHGRIFPQQAAYTLTLLGAGLFSMLLLLCAWLVTNRWLVRPYSQIMGGIGLMGEKNLSGRLRPTGFSHMDVLVDNINTMLSRLEESSNRTFEAQQTLYEAKLYQQRIEMYLLHKQIDAHFLYNSLIGIKALADQGEADRAGEVAQGVAALLRYAHDTRGSVPIFDEMSIIQRYVNIMNVRFAGRFALSFEVDDRLADYLMLKMLLQPLVENALVHGLEPSDRPALLEVRGSLEAEAVVLSVWDNGAGIPPAALAHIQQRLGEDPASYAYLDIQGISLINIQRRVESAYGPPYGLTIESALGQFTRVMLRIPRVQLGEGQ